MFPFLFFPTHLHPHPLTTDETTPDIRESPHDTQCTMPVLRDDSAAEAKKSEKVLLTGLHSEAQKGSTFVDMAQGGLASSPPTSSTFFSITGKFAPSMPGETDLTEPSYTVVVTARSEEKGKRIIDAIPADLRDRVSYVVVSDIAQPGAFDKAVVSDPPFDFVIHTASPYQLHFDDPIADCLDPAIKGTTGILESIHAFAPTVKRVVITSSSAAILDPPNHRKVYDESVWSSVTLDQATEPEHTYRASKVH